MTMTMTTIHHLKQQQQHYTRVVSECSFLATHHDIKMPFYSTGSESVVAVRPRRRRISPTYRVEFPWSRSRRLTSQAAVEFIARRRRRI